MYTSYRYITIKIKVIQGWFLDLRHTPTSFFYPHDSKITNHQSKIKKCSDFIETRYVYHNCHGDSEKNAAINDVTICGYVKKFGIKP